MLVEQFRPGVMDRLGLGYEAMRAINPGLVYCAITGWGQHGPLADMAAHDLNYQAETGLLALTAGADGAPGLPNVLAADLVGGAYPAIMNILLALRARDATGRGCFIDVAMADNLFPLVYWGLGNGFAAGEWPTPGGDLVTGGTPRYQIYRTGTAATSRRAAGAEVLGELPARAGSAAAAGRRGRSAGHARGGRGHHRQPHRGRMAAALRRRRCLRVGGEVAAGGGGNAAFPRARAVPGAHRERRRPRHPVVAAADRAGPPARTPAARRRRSEKRTPLRLAR